MSDSAALDQKILNDLKAINNEVKASIVLMDKDDPAMELQGTTKLIDAMEKIAPILAEIINNGGTAEDIQLYFEESGIAEDVMEAIEILQIIVNDDDDRTPELKVLLDRFMAVSDHLISYVDVQDAGQKSDRAPSAASSPSVMYDVPGNQMTAAKYAAKLLEGEAISHDELAADGVAYTDVVDHLKTVYGDLPINMAVAPEPLVYALKELPDGQGGLVPNYGLEDNMRDKQDYVSQFAREEAAPQTEMLRAAAPQPLDNSVKAFAPS